MARHVRTTVTMLVLIGILCTGAWYGWTGLQAQPDDDTDTTATPTEPCPTPRPVTVRSRRTVVSVYNAGAPTGTGGEVMEVLDRRGFRRGEIDDAPGGATVRGAVIWTRRPDAPEIRLVARQLRGVRIREQANPPGPGVNVLIGDNFRGFRKPKRSLVVRPEPDC